MAGEDRPSRDRPGTSSPPRAGDPGPATDRTTSISRPSPDPARAPGFGTLSTGREATGTSGPGRAGGAASAFSLDEVVGRRYRIVRFISKGGMGEVYEAEDTELGERVALKTLLPEIAEDEESLLRFKREIHLSRRVTHPNVCRIFDLGHHSPEGDAGGAEMTFLTMELLPGETLSQGIKREGRMEPEQALPLVRQMAAALATAHAAGIVHRDFKSSNVVLVAGEKGERAVVTDFGLARAAAGGSDSSASITGTGMVVGTPAYMSPEQIQGKKTGPATDIYSLGVVMYEMVTGTWPFGGDSPMSVAAKRLTEKPEPPRRRVANLDPRWERTILRCLEIKPEDRFESAADVVLALAGEPVAGKSRPRWQIGAAAAGVVGLLALGYLVSDLQHAPPAAPASVSPAPRAASVKVRPSVAVLGFKNLGKPEADWLSTAISEMLRTELATGEELRTVPGEDVARMQVELDLAQSDSLARDTLTRIRAHLGADLVVLGSYLSIGDETSRLRLDLRLQDTRAGELVASAAHTGTEEQLFELVSASGVKLRQALGLGVVSESEARAIRASLPASPAAAEYYAKGLARLRVFDALGARDQLEKAVAEDPEHPLVCSALAKAWSALGYDLKARQEATRAFELSKDLSREQRLTVEAQYHATLGDTEKAVETYRGLFVFFPDNLDYGLQLANAQTDAGQARAALATIEELRALPPPASDDPRLDLAEAAAAKALTDFPRQQRAAARAATNAQRLGARLLYAQARLAEGTALVNMGKLEEARAPAAEASRILAAAGDRRGVARAENIIGVSYAMAGDIDIARARFEESLEASRKIGDQSGVALQLGNIGSIYDLQGKPDDARQKHRSALEVAREIGDKSGAARHLNNLALLSERTGDLKGAENLYRKALELFRETGEERYVGLAIANIGEVLAKQGRIAEARSRFEESLEISRAAGAETDVAGTLTLMGRLLAGQGDLLGAQTRLQEALALYRADDDAEGEVEALRELAGVRVRQGDAAAARELRDQADALEGADVRPPSSPH